MFITREDKRADLDRAPCGPGAHVHAHPHSTMYRWDTEDPQAREGPGHPASWCRADAKPSPCLPPPRPMARGAVGGGCTPGPGTPPRKHPQITLSCVLVPQKYPVETAFGF